MPTLHNIKTLFVRGKNGEFVPISAIQGRGIEEFKRTSGNGSPGSADEYTITYSDGTTDTLTIHNGRDGAMSEAEVARMIQQYFVDHPGSGGGSASVSPATKDRLGVVSVGENLTVTEEGKLSVDTTEKAEEGGVKPITSGGVYTILGNINALLAAI